MNSSNDIFSSPNHGMNLGSNSNQSPPSQRETPQRESPNTFGNLGLIEFNKCLTLEEIERASQDPRVVQIVDELVSVDPNRFFYALANKGGKPPSKYDVSSLMEGATQTQNQGFNQNTFSLGMSSSQQMFTSLPLGTTTHMATNVQILIHQHLETRELMPQHKEKLLHLVPHHQAPWV